MDTSFLKWCFDLIEFWLFDLNFWTSLKIVLKQIEDRKRL